MEAAAASPGRPPAKHPSRGGPPLAARDTGRWALRNFESERPPAQLLGDSGGPSLCRAALGTAAPASTTCYSWPIPSPRPSAPELYPHSPGPPRGAEDEDQAEDKDVPQRRAGQAAPATSASQPREAHKHRSRFLCEPSRAPVALTSATPRTVALGRASRMALASAPPGPESSVYGSKADVYFCTEDSLSGCHSHLTLPFEIKSLIPLT